MYGVRLRNLRKDKGWTMEEVASKLDLKLSTYSGYETKYRKPTIDTILKIAKLYDVSTDYILGLTDEPNIQKLEYNARNYLRKNNLHYEGVPLTEEELRPLRDLFEVVLRDRIPKDDNDT